MTIQLRLAALSLAAGMLTGCGGRADRIDTFPASGQVLWEGQPLAGALVVLHPQTAGDTGLLPARAETDEQGKFVLGTYDSEDGVPAGDYRVTVHWHPLQKNGESFEPGPDVVPAQYSDPAQSELKISIAAGENQIPPLNLRR
jgi:hypothetical protein